MTNTIDFICVKVLALHTDLTIVHNLPWRQTFHVVLTKDLFDPVQQIWNVEQSDVPTGNDIGIVVFPISNELEQKIRFIFTPTILDQHTFRQFKFGFSWIIVTHTPNMIYIAFGRFICNGNDWMFGFIGVRKAIIRCNLDVDIADGNVVHIELNITWKLFGQKLSHIVRIAVNTEVMYTIIEFDKICSFRHAVEFHFFDWSSVKSCGRMRARRSDIKRGLEFDALLNGSATVVVTTVQDLVPVTMHGSIKTHSNSFR